MQSDNLESCFGWYRQMHEGNYLISLKQLLESERKKITTSLLKHCGLRGLQGEITEPDSSQELSCGNIADLIAAELTYLNFLSPDERIILVAGAFARSINQSKRGFP